MKLTKATRKKAKLRMGLSAVAGGGKTYSALLLAYGMTNDWNKIAVIDTENNSASLYSHLGGFNALELQAPYSPERYIEAIKACENEGMEVIIIDSITHEWDGKGGCLEIVEKLGGRYQDWSKVTPRHQSFIDAILQSKAHVITTVRRKQDYEMSKGADNKIKVEKAGLKEITREGFEYELTLNINIDLNHLCTASKDRTGLFMDKPSFIITPETGRLIKDWCDEGEAEISIEEAINRLSSCNSVDDLTLLKETLPQSIIADKAFQTAGKKRFELLTQKSELPL
ncbi:MAG: AAA family ATPase [Pseudomonadota bacterium]|nr:AAA family ATPase [Pseudomonadota bacterium]